MNFKAGTLLQDGRYVIDVALGRGYFGATYRAMHANLVQPVAIKTLDDSLRKGEGYEDFKRQFIEQARHLAKCATPYLPRLLDIFEEDDRPFVVMDYIPGSTLSQLVASGRPMPVDRALSYVHQMGAALAVIHAEGLLHRDIQPDNAIRQFGTDRIVTIDIGLTRDFTTGINQTHCNLLAAGYAAPEQYGRNGAHTVATDVYSLAAVLYFLLTGTTPIAAPLRDRVPLQSVRELNSSVSPELDAAIAAGLAIEPNARPHSIDDFLAKLPEPVPSTPRSPKPSRETSVLPPFARPWVPAVFAVTSIVSAIGGAGSIMLLRASNAQVDADPLATLQELRETHATDGSTLFDNRAMPETSGMEESVAEYDREVELGSSDWNEPQYAVPASTDEAPVYAAPSSSYSEPDEAFESVESTDNSAGAASEWTGETWEAAPTAPEDELSGDPAVESELGTSYSTELETVPDGFDPRGAFESEPLENESLESAPIETVPGGSNVPSIPELPIEPTLPVIETPLPIVEPSPADAQSVPNPTLELEGLDKKSLEPALEG